MKPKYKDIKWLTPDHTELSEPEFEPKVSDSQLDTFDNLRWNLKNGKQADTMRKHEYCRQLRSWIHYCKIQI